MKKLFFLFFLVSLQGLLLYGQVKQKQPLTDALNRIILDEKGNRINYHDPVNHTYTNEQKFPSSGHKTTDAPETIPVCSPQWFQGIMGACIGLNSMISKDIDHDGKTEIICGAGSGFGSGTFWYVLKYDAVSQDYKQIWMSAPVDYYYGGDNLFSCIRAFDTDNDNIYEIYVGFNGGKVDVYSGAGMELIQSFSSEAESVNDMIFADADNDGEKEIVLCDGSNTYLFNSSSLTLKSTIPYGSQSFAAGNVDSDPRIEIVYSGGAIVDLTGTTPVVEWNIYTPPIYNAFVALTDTDNDGMDEVIIANSWEVIEIYNADIKALKGSITTDIDIDALLVTDVNGDDKEEILYGDGQWGDIFCYNSLSLQKMWSIPNPEHGVTMINVADADNDGVLEVLWGAGCSSTGPDYLYLHNITDQALEFRSKDITGPFHDVEIGDVDGDGHDEIATVSYESESGYESGILSIFDGTSHNLKWQSSTNFFPNTWEGVNTLELANLNGDARKEIIVATDDLYDGVIYVVDGLSHQIISSHDYSSAGIGNFKALEVSDVDNDGSLEFIASDDAKLFVINSSDYAIEWTSPAVSGYGTRSVMTGNLDSDANPEIVLCYGYIMIFDGITHEQWLSSESNYTNIDLYDWDNDGFLEIIASTDNGKIRLIDRQNDLTTTLQQFGNSPIDGIRVVNLDGSGLAEFVYTSGAKMFFANAAGDNISTANFGPEAGSYDALKISDINLDQVYEIFAGTRYQVVQVSEECSQCLGFKVQASGTKASCVPGNDGTATATVSAGTDPYTYLWRNGNTQQTNTGLAPGEYWVSVTDSKGCPAHDTLTIDQSELITAISGKSVGCNGIQDGSASIYIITGTPPYLYNWSNGGNQSQISGLSSGRYSCVVSDQMGCSVTKTISIIKDTLVIDLITEDPQCFGYGGTGMVQVLSGTPPFVYQWGSIQGYSVMYNLPAGGYILTVTDTLNCTAVEPFTIIEPPQLILVTSFIPDDPNTIVPDGQATVTVTGGTPPYYYQWNDPYYQTNSTAISLPNGHYEVTVSDHNICYQTAAVEMFNLSVEGAGQGIRNFSVFPNPACNFMQVTTEFTHPVSGTLQLTDLFGIVIDSRTFSDHSSGNFTFDLKELPPSMYFMVLKAGELSQSRKFLISK
jgi:hypothetical protein